MYLALKEMKKNKSRFALIIAIILLISYLVFFLSALADGLSNDKVSAINLWNSKQVVLNKDANGNVMRSQIPYKQMTNYDEEKASPLTIMRESTFINDHRKKDDLLDVVLMGTDRDSYIWPKVIEGKEPSKKGEVIVSENMKKENALKVGDSLQLSDGNAVLKVTGITEPSKYGNTPVVYGTPDMIYSIMAKAKGMPEQYVKENSMVNALVLQKDTSVKNTAELESLTTSQFIKDLPGYKAEQMTFLMMIGFLIVISAIILGVFLYIITLQKKNTFGIMKIQGITGSYIGRSVMAETVIMSVAGVFIGMVLTLLTGAVLPPAVPFKANPAYFAAMAAFMIGTSVIGSLFSMRSVSKIDPLKALG